ncbi:MAG: hypothetical protein HC820_08885 [Hydrococcus sp. RM1_1_31]|nr:hypothetical protein [Hydrococcus sp. RM1_1_31]
MVGFSRFVKLSDNQSRGDRFVSLAGYVKRAESAKADAFVSIHANAVSVNH